MGCDIHTFAERLESGVWVRVPTNPDLFDWRSYGMFGFLADVRNYSAVPPIIPQRRGIPEDASAEVRAEWGEDCGWIGGHSASWLSLTELTKFDYDRTFVNRRVPFEYAPGCWDLGHTAVGDEFGSLPVVSYFEFLGTQYFDDLRRMRDLNVDRLVFWFDN